MTITQMHAQQGLSAVVARRVRGLLAEEGLHQQHVGAAIGVSPSAMSARARGAKPFELDELITVAEVLNTTLEYLLGLTDDRGARSTDGYIFGRRAAALAPLATVLRFPIERARSAA